MLFILYGISATVPVTSSAQYKLIECDTVLPYRGANWKYGLASVDGRKIAEPQFDEIVMTRKNYIENYYLFYNRDGSRKSGIVDHTGEILTANLPGVPFHNDIEIKRCIVSYTHNYLDLVVYSGCLKKLVGSYKNAAINLKPGVSRVSLDKPTEKAIPNFVISGKDFDRLLYFNRVGEKLTKSNWKDQVSCGGRYGYYYPEKYEKIKSSKSNVEIYKSYFPDYEIIEEYYNQEGSLSILAKKDHKYGLINSKGEILLPFKYNFIKFSEGLLVIKESYRGIAECNGTIIYEPNFTYISINDPFEGLILVDSYLGCRGYIDFEGNMFLPLDCLKN